MACEETRDVFGRYVDDEASLALRTDIAAHVTFCSPCSQEFDAVRQPAAPSAKPPPVHVPSTA